MPIEDFSEYIHAVYDGVCPHCSKEWDEVDHVDCGEIEKAINEEEAY